MADNLNELVRKYEHQFGVKLDRHDFAVVEWFYAASERDRKLAEAKCADKVVERSAQLSAHRVCIGLEHNPTEGKLHGYCVVCGAPWPCEYAGNPPTDNPGLASQQPNGALDTLVNEIRSLKQQLHGMRQPQTEATCNHGHPMWAWHLAKSGYEDGKLDAYCSICEAVLAEREKYREGWRSLTDDIEHIQLLIEEHDTYPMDALVNDKEIKAGTCIEGCTKCELAALIERLKKEER